MSALTNKLRINTLKRLVKCHYATIVELNKLIAVIESGNEKASRESPKTDSK